jgi:hypothetical protein
MKAIGLGTIRNTIQRAGARLSHQEPEVNERFISTGPFHQKVEPSIFDGCRPGPTGPQRCSIALRSLHCVMNEPATVQLLEAVRSRPGLDALGGLLERAHLVGLEHRAGEGIEVLEVGAALGMCID